MATIKPIDAASVHRICSGQVVIDLATAAKELVENSLDAGATTVTIKFKNYGLDLLEVEDNGSGISSEDYDNIGLKHYTSKLTTFENLDNLETYGFRGEAISSLCTLSQVEILTATQDSVPRGTKLKLDHTGQVIEKKVASSKRGTTISVANLFSTLPVRRKEFSKNCKREFAKAITLLQGYALIKTNVKISVFHQPPNGSDPPPPCHYASLLWRHNLFLLALRYRKSSVQLSTNGNGTIRENITNVFGAKILTSLEPLNLHLEIDIRHIGGRRTTETIDIVGYISKCSHGEGRSSSDRQFFYINSRPCTQVKIARTFNEIYRSYNSHQYPFILADFRLAPGTFDLNLTPDKRTILLHDEQTLIKELSDRLTQFYDSFQHTLPLSQFLLSKTPRRTERIKAESPDEPLPFFPQTPTSNSQPRHPPVTDPPSDTMSSEFGESQTPRRQSRVVDLSSVEKTVSNVTGEFRDRLATYALGSPEGRGLDKTLTPVPEVVTQQISPTSRINRGQRASDDNDDAEMDDNDDDVDNNEDEDQVDDEEEEKNDEMDEISEEDAGEVSIRTRRDKRTLATIITPSQLERIIGPPNKKARSEEPKTPPRRVGLFQQTLRDHFVRRADPNEAKGRGDEGLDLLSPEQVTALLAKVARDDDNGDDDEEDEEEQEQGGQEEEEEIMEEVEAEDQAAMDNDDQGNDPEEGDESEMDEDSDQMDIDKSQEFTSQDYNPDEPIADPPEQHTHTRIPNQIPSTPPKSERNLFKSRRKNEVHTLRHLAHPTLPSIQFHHNSLRQPHPSHRGEILSKEYTLPNEKAEERLSLTVSKEDFARMRIVGQFNLGFIIAVREREDQDVEDVFIIDQHASDEKFNFERLQAETVMQVQTLARPQMLELTAMEESIVLDHLDVFKLNGFDIRDEGSVTGKRCFLHAIPMSGNTVFTLSDLEELIHLVQLHPDKKSVRCSKARAMFAMRACRSSIMIGRALSQKMMEKVVRNLGGLDKPWSCPHGRPTMRHLTELDGWSSWDGDMQS